MRTSKLVSPAAIRDRRPGWNLWVDGVTGGETVEEVGARADRVIAELRGDDDDALLFAHGHLLRVFAARWLELEPSASRLFSLDPATLSVISCEDARPVLRAWNQRC